MTGPITFDPILAPTLEMACDGVAAFKAVATPTDANFAKLKAHQFTSYVSPQQTYVGMGNNPWAHTAYGAWQTVPANLIPVTTLPTTGVAAFLLDVAGQINTADFLYFGVKVSGAVAIEPQHTAVACKAAQQSFSRMTIIPVTPGAAITFTPQTFTSSSITVLRYGAYRILTFREPQ